MRRSDLFGYRPTHCGFAFALVVFALVFSAALPSAATDVSPYEARIVTPGAAVHGGPGENFYPTDTLAQGDVVEVYREEPGGWLGIRPPENSFSWIFGRHVKLLEGDLAEVDKDDVPSRIGSRLGDKRNAAQIRLKKGEVVEILGEATTDGEAWYKIAPPSGEFRWIHARNVDRPHGLAPMPAADSTAPPVVTVPTADEAGLADSAVTLAADSQPASDENWRASPNGAAAATAADSAPAENAPPATKTQPAVTPPAAVVPPSPPPAGPINDSLARQLTEIELRLSRIVAEPPVTWQIEPLRREAEQLLGQSASDSDRASVNSTIAKLDRFTAIARRYQQVAVGAAPTGPPPMPSIATTTNAIGPDGQRYDAIGILRPVVSKRPGAPQFALVDERGQVVSFVTPTPDMNLQPYLGHRIGITGSRGFIPEFQRAHVTAGRVAPLTQGLMR